MNYEYKQLLDDSFSPDSRVWIYQSSRVFSLSEAFDVEDMLNSFTASWLSHGTPVKGAGHLFFGQFVALMADETAAGVSGCSTDSSVRLIKDIEQRFGVNMFDRLNLAFVIKDSNPIAKQPVRVASIKYQRIPSKPFFYTLWKGILLGITKSVME